jgi:hypothetical protein
MESTISSAHLCRTKGLGLSFLLVIQVRIEAVRSRIVRWLPRLIQVLV